MQEVKFLRFSALVVVLLLPFAAAGGVDPAMAEKVKKLTQTAVAEARREASKNSRDAIIMEGVGVKLQNMQTRLNTIKNSLDYFSKFKKRMYADAMGRFQDEVARACCPLKSPRVLDNEIWWARNRGHKQKGKGMSGARNKKDGSGQRKKGRKKGGA